jgi:hypothetical protein
VLGVQWHPEVDETSRLIATLVDEAREAQAGRSIRASSSTGNGDGSVLAR